MLKQLRRNRGLPQVELELRQLPLILQHGHEALVGVVLQLSLCEGL